MSDYFLIKMWKDIKDSSWPDIQTWDDFLQLPQWIKDECYQLHDIKSRMKEIEDPNYWLLHCTGLWAKKDKFVFVNVPKCGSTHYSDFFFDRLGWEKFSPQSVSDFDNHIKFGLMMHPLDRYLKGLTEYIWLHNLAGKIDIEKFVITSHVPDVHSIPYNEMFGDMMSDIHWIPFGNMQDHEVKQAMNNLFKRYDSKIKVPTSHPIIHKSSAEKLKLFNDIKTHWGQREAPKLPTQNNFNYNLYTLYKSYAKDLKFYRNLVESFKNDWSHLEPQN